jgi:hypothetical protein
MADVAIFGRFMCKRRELNGEFNTSRKDRKQDIFYQGPKGNAGF